MLKIMETPSVEDGRKQYRKLLSNLYYVLEDKRHLNDMACRGSWGAMMSYDQDNARYKEQIAHIEGHLSAIEKIFKFTAREVKKLKLEAQLKAEGHSDEDIVSLRE